MSNCCFIFRNRDEVIVILVCFSFCPYKTPDIHPEVVAGSQMMLLTMLTCLRYGYFAMVEILGYLVGKSSLCPVLGIFELLASVPCVMFVIINWAIWLIGFLVLHRYPISDSGV